MAVGCHEHVLGATQPDALGPERARAPRILGDVGVGAHAKCAQLVGPRQYRLEVRIHLRVHQRHVVDRDVSGGAVDRDQVAFVENHPTDADRASREVDIQAAGSAHAGAAHAACDKRRVRRLAALTREDALGGEEPGDVLSLGERPHQHDMGAGLGCGDGRWGAENDRALGGARGGGNATRQHLVGRLGIESRMQQRIERRGVDRCDGLHLAEQPLAHGVDREADSRLRGPLGVARLQHVQAPFLDRELGVLDVAVMVFELAQDARELCVGLGQHVVELG